MVYCNNEILFLDIYLFMVKYPSFLVLSNSHCLWRCVGLNCMHCICPYTIGPKRAVLTFSRHTYFSTDTDSGRLILGEGLIQ